VPAHAVRRRPVAPALLLTVAASALGGLALMPSHHVPAPTVLASSSSAQLLEAEAERAAILGRPPVRRTTVIKTVKPAAPRKVAPRAARKRVVEAPPLNIKGYVCPVRGRTSFTDTWGDARAGHRHQGTDIMAAYGLPVVAVISGTIKTDYSSAGGISLYLRGTDGNEYFYAHNSRNVAVTGQHVTTGQVIAYVGNTGNARGGASHVHFERHPGGGAAVDPYPFLRRIC
jgi:murein DD-endopeptidase MepM/ murein hydrolase activator NlpD